MNRISLCFAGVAIAVAVVPPSFGNGLRPAPSGSNGHVQPAVFVGGPPATVSLYSQLANDSAVAIVSQNFESGYDQFDSQAADSFFVPTGHVWTITQVNVVGQYFNGTGPAVSENVFFYRNNAGSPGALFAEFANVQGTDNGGSFKIVLPGSVRLPTGAYWVSVQANMDFASGGEWGWETATVQRGAPAFWQNPGDGLATGCTTWTALTTCVSFSGGPDFMFALKGTDKTL